MNERRQIPVIVRLVLTTLAMIAAFIPVMFLILLPGTVFFVVGLLAIPVVGGFVYSRSGPVGANWRSSLRPAVVVGSMFTFVCLIIFALFMAVLSLFGDAPDDVDREIQITAEFHFFIRVAGWLALQFVVVGLLGGAGGLIDFARRRKAFAEWNDEPGASDARETTTVGRLDPWA